MSNIQNAVEIELLLWEKQSNDPGEQEDQRLEWQETGAAVCPWEGGPEEYSILESVHGEGVSINPRSASKKKKASS